MVDLHTFCPISERRPETCSGDHCSSRISRKTSARSARDIERFPGFLDLRLHFFNSACLGSYTPLTFELRVISRETVLVLTFITWAMKVLLIFFWSNTLIVYLCSDVNCYTYCNTKIINLRERDKCLSLFFVLLLNINLYAITSSLEASRLQPHGKPLRCFS